MNESHGWRALRARPLLRWLLAVLAAIIAMPSTADIQHPDRIVIGRITDNPRVDYVRLKRLLDVVVPKLSGHGIREGAVLLARDPQQMAGYLRRGRVDWVTETPAMAAELENRSGAHAFLRALREDRNVYRSLVFVRRDSGIRSLADLRGKRLALQTRSSTSAFYLPLITLLGAGLPLTELGKPDDYPAANEVGFLLARSELNIAIWVHKGLADAGAFSNLDWDNPRRMPPSFREDFRVIAESDSVPRAIELVRGDLPPVLTDALRDVLLVIDRDPTAGEAMRGYFDTARFEAIDAQTRRALSALNARILPLRRELER
ncbi:MAG: phosphate/phosphite/phosphonate ABC transporter substrate-binding protein [Rhodanobacteraceae bacterium]|nr:phosphate/phosphite/phosphonate ABC transporter substrate-binding protein [Rhodanobacteraceae bacterium]MBK7044510.1 phosphate/phosphite/phosphonate ABC transporter substrate-binding protein [Rhodanobacteraceae bacterium]MBP9154318.1 phosphate/phosphite/phosphonate ABC transporter substrate-binding protein [Xanthomonadales bacterium]HQW81338.1 phosphate/phosphite/phosphonate ABC transporter substrate-binding protein [Pseudomonadota bacterium]